jgi:hypothetical protein
MGWEVFLSWQDGSTSWHTLLGVGNFSPSQLAEYATENILENELAFPWWVKYTLIKAIESRHSQCSHKFCIVMTRNLEEALQID